jgi:hypothetical protein
VEGVSDWYDIDGRLNCPCCGVNHWPYVERGGKWMFTSNWCAHCLNSHHYQMIGAHPNCLATRRGLENGKVWHPYA